MGENFYAAVFFFHYHVEGLLVGVVMAIKKIKIQTSTPEAYCLIGGIKQAYKIYLFIEYEVD